MTLTIVGALPLLGALLIALIGNSQKENIKRIALLTSILTFAATVLVAINFEINRPGFQFVEKYSWIPSLGVNFQVGIDGISLILILLSTILVPVVILAGWNESEGGRFSVKTFYILMLVLETMMIGVFAATDVFLFYIFFEAMLVPVYFLIGGFGSGARRPRPLSSFFIAYLAGF